MTVSADRPSQPAFVFRLGSIIVAVLILLYLVIVLRTAWLSDDAYITFRTVDNFVNGYGLTWNVDERVQTFTNPLWMLLVSAVYFFTREIFFTASILSIATSAATVWLVGYRAANSTWAAAAGLTALMLSKAYIDFSTSGLENPLSHLLLAAFLVVYYRSSIVDVKTLLILSIVAGLATLNRMDTVPVYLPVLGLALARLRSWRAAGTIALGFLPFAVWEIFSLIYYGFPFPNSAYAKLNNGIDSVSLVVQGLHYLQQSLAADPLTLGTISAGVITAVVRSIRSKSWRDVAVIAGIVLYIAYVVKIGGDFMSGRFLALPLLGAVIVIVQVQRAPIARWSAALAAILIVGLLSPNPTPASGPDYGADPAKLIYGDNTTPGYWGIADERGYYFRCASLTAALANPEADYPNCSTAELGSLVRLEGLRTVEQPWIGYFGFNAGPHTHIVDRLGLGDPLLARLTPKWRPDWRIGHFKRDLPSNYIETVDGGQNRLLDPALAAYFERLSLVTRGKILDPQRLTEIWKFNTGQNDYLLERYSSHSNQ